MFLLFSKLGKGLGFEEYIISKEREFQKDIKKMDFYFKINSKTMDKPAKLIIVEKDSSSEAFFPEPLKFYKVNGDQVHISSYSDSNFSITFLTLHYKTCSDYSYNLDFGSYINFQNVLFNQSDEFCVFSLSQDLNYRILLDCQSATYDSVCYVTSQSQLIQNKPGEPCPPNQTCDIPVDYGFLISLKRYDKNPSLLSMQAFSIKGRTQKNSCNMEYINQYSISGLKEINSEQLNINVSCDSKQEPFYLAIIMISTILLIIFSVLIIYYLLRPNKAYAPFEDENKEVFLPNNSKREEKAGFHIFSASEVALAH